VVGESVRKSNKDSHHCRVHVQRIEDGYPGSNGRSETENLFPHCQWHGHTLNHGAKDKRCWNRPMSKRMAETLPSGTGNESCPFRRWEQSEQWELEWSHWHAIEV
jgi:hypothetical protein